MTTLKNFKDIESIDIGSSWQFKVVKARYWWTLLFGFLTGDLNAVHVSPLSLLDYKKKTFKKLARHGASTLSQSAGYVFKTIEFDEPTEVIAKGYDKIRFTRPVLMGDKIFYEYKVKSRKLNLEKGFAEIVYEITVKNQNDELLMIAEWIIMYFPVEINQITTAPLPSTGYVTEMKVSHFIIFSICKLALLLGIGYLAWKYKAVPDPMSASFLVF